MFSPARSETSGRYDEVVLPSLLHIEEHLEQPLTLDDLAAVAGFSPHHFHRVFHHVTGEAPKAYLRRLRLERAVYRMKVSPDSVLRIAVDSGFSSNETFTRAFVRRFGVSPSEFRSVLKEYREIVGDLLASETFEGFTHETPLTLRFDMQKHPVSVVRTPERHVLFVRHHGYERLLAPGERLERLWDRPIAYAEAHGIAFDRGILIGITHDDPYVTDESHMRYDAGIEVAGPVAPDHPVTYRRLPPRLCVVRRHTGGLEEIAKTFAHIGVDWIPSHGYGLAAAPPFEVYTCTRAPGGRLTIRHADAHVPLDTIEGES